MDEKIKESLQWLIDNGLALYEQAKGHWEITHETRYQESLSIKDKPVIETILKKYDVLKRPSEGHKFIALDFKKLNPKSFTRMNINYWNQFIEPVLTMLQQMKPDKEPNRDKLKTFLKKNDLSQGDSNF